MELNTKRQRVQHIASDIDSSDCHDSGYSEAETGVRQICGYSSPIPQRLSRGSYNKTLPVDPRHVLTNMSAERASKNRLHVHDDQSSNGSFSVFCLNGHDKGMSLGWGEDRGVGGTVDEEVGEHFDGLLEVEIGSVKGGRSVQGGNGVVELELDDVCGLNYKLWSRSS